MLRSNDKANCSLLSIQAIVNILVNNAFGFALSLPFAEFWRLVFQPLKIMSHPYIILCLKPVAVHFEIQAKILSAPFRHTKCHNPYNSNRHCILQILVLIRFL